MAGNGDQQSTKSAFNRKRVSQACNRCRIQKDKCDGIRPTCSSCAMLDQSCSYDPSIKKRGLPEGYVRGLKKLWGLAIRSVPGIENAVLSILRGENGSDGQDSLYRIWNDEEGMESLLETWRKSKISQELERLVPVLEGGEEKGGKRKREEIDPHFAGDPRSSIPLPWDAGQDGSKSGTTTHTASSHPSSTPKQIHDIQPRQTNPGSLKISGELLADLERVESGVGTIKVPNTTKTVRASDEMDRSIPLRAWHLIDLYFAYTHCWLPIVERHNLLRTAYLYSEGSLEYPLKNGSGDHAVLWAVLAYADLQFSVLDAKGPELNGPIDPHWTSESLYSHARDLIPREEERFESGHVQALLILALCNIGQGRWQAAWLLSGHASRITVDLGLGKATKDCGQEMTGKQSHSRGRHVLLGCFVLDTLISARLGRTPYLCNLDVKSAGYLEEDGLEEWDPWVDCVKAVGGRAGAPPSPLRAISTFNALVRGLLVLNVTIREQAEGRNSRMLVETLFKDLNEAAHAQSFEFLNDLSKPSITDSSLSALPQQYNLRMVYISIACVLVLWQMSIQAPLMEDVNNLGHKPTLNPHSIALQSLKLLRQLRERLGLRLVPPIFEFSITLVFNCMKLPQNPRLIPHIIPPEWSKDMAEVLTEMEKTWPVFTPLRRTLVKSLDSGRPMTNRSASKMVISSSQMSPTRVQPITVTSALSDSVSKHRHVSSHSKGVTVPLSSSYPNTGSIDVSRPYTINSDLMQATKELQSTSNSEVNQQSSTNILSTNNLHQTQSPESLFMKDQNLFDLTKSYQSDLPGMATAHETNPDLGDSIFNEFAMVDAMEWSVLLCNKC